MTGYARPLHEVPDWLTLPEVVPGFRQVDGRPMSREEYEACGWHVVDRYEVEHPHRDYCSQTTRIVSVWSAGTLAQLLAWGRKRADERQQRHLDWVRRQEEDESLRDYVDAIDDAVPGGRR